MNHKITKPLTLIELEEWCQLKNITIEDKTYLKYWEAFMGYNFLRTKAVDMNLDSFNIKSYCWTCSKPFGRLDFMSIQKDKRVNSIVFVCSDRCKNILNHALGKKEECPFRKTNHPHECTMKKNKTLKSVIVGVKRSMDDSHDEIQQKKSKFTIEPEKNMNIKGFWITKDF